MSLDGVRNNKWIYQRSNRLWRTKGNGDSNDEHSHQKGQGVRPRGLALIIILVIMMCAAIILGVYFGVHSGKRHTISQVKGEVRVTNLQYTDALADPGSEEYQQLEADFCTEMDKLYSTGLYSDIYMQCFVDRFEEGSVLIKFTVEYDDPNQMLKLQKQVFNDITDVAEGNLPEVFEEFDIDAHSVNVVVLEVEEQNAADECISKSPCQNAGSCENTDLSYICHCRGTGYSGVNCEKEIDECLDSPCENGGNCTNTEGPYRCDCAATYRGVNCEEDNDDILNIISNLQDQLVAEIQQREQLHSLFEEMSSRQQQQNNTLNSLEKGTTDAINLLELNVSTLISTLDMNVENIENLRSICQDTQGSLVNTTNSIESALQSSISSMQQSINDVSITQQQNIDDLLEQVQLLKWNVSTLQSEIDVNVDKISHLQNDFDDIQDQVDGLDVTMLSINQSHINAVEELESMLNVTSIEMEANVEELHRLNDRVQESLVNATDILSNKIDDNVSNLETQLDELRNVIRVKTRSAFLAKGLSDSGVKLYSAGERLVFPVVFHNEGGYYNNVTGEYTCPVTGTYFVSYSLRASDITHPLMVSVGLYRGSDKQAQIFLYNSDEGKILLTVSQSEIIICNADEVVWLQVEASDTQLFGATDLNLFSAILISPELS